MIKLEKKRFVTGGVALGASLALALTACSGGGEESPDATPDATTSGDAAVVANYDLTNEGELAICTDSPFAPFIFEDADSDLGYTGLEIELQREIAKRLGLEMSVNAMSFEAIQSGLALNSRQCDLAGGGMFITEERAKNLNFSEGYIQSQEGLLVEPGSPITSLTEMAGKKLGVHAGTTGEAYAKENAPEGTEIIQYGSNAELMLALEAGNVEAIILDLFVLGEHQEKSDSFKLAEVLEIDNWIGFGFRKEGSDELREAVNAQIEAIQADGTWDELFKEFVPVELPS